jgi:rusticyanin
MNRSISIPALAVGAALVLLLGAGAVMVGAAVLTQGNGYGPGMMGGYYGQGQNGGTVAPSTAAQLGQAAPAGATVNEAANSITFGSTTVNLTVLGAPSDGPDETFRVAGLTNPTIVVPSGAHVTLTLINADPGMDHNWLLTSVRPPFSTMSMMIPTVFGAATTTLSEASGTSMPEATVTFTASTRGQYTYLCTVPGHAAEGMYGTFEVN